LSRLESVTIKNSTTGCWLVGNYNNIYGNIKIGKFQYLVHRLSAYIFFDFDIRSEVLQVNHTRNCPNKNCWNPEHIYVGTQKQNMSDIPEEKMLGKCYNFGKGGPEKESQRKTHCINGHELTEENIYKIKKGNFVAHVCRICKTDNLRKYRMNKKTKIT
jgi:hypothetical protein